MTSGVSMHAMTRNEPPQHATVFDVDVEDSLDAASSSWAHDQTHGARGRSDGQGWG